MITYLHQTNNAKLYSDLPGSTPVKLISGKEIRISQSFEAAAVQQYTFAKVPYNH